MSEEMNFSGGGFEVKESGNKPGKSIKPGVQVAMITSVEYFVSSQKGTKGMKINLETAPVEGLVDEDDNKMGQKANTTLWMSSGAWDVQGAMWCSKARLSVIADKLGVRTEFDAISGNAEEFVSKVNELFKGKKARWAFGGEWQSFEGDSGTITFIRPNLLTFGFVESLTEVPNDADTKLKVDENNPHHVKPLEVADATATDGAPSISEEPAW